MFPRRIRSLYDKLPPKQTKPGRSNTVPTKRYNPGEKVFFRIFKDIKCFGEAGAIEGRVGNMMHVVKGQQFTHKRHFNKLRRHISNEADSSPSGETVMDIMSDTFNIPTAQAAPEIRRSKRKNKATDLIIINSKRRRIIQHVNRWKTNKPQKPFVR